MTWKNSASHTVHVPRTAWTVTSAATVEGESGDLIREFRSRATAERYAAEVGSLAIPVERDHLDRKLNGSESGWAQDGNEVKGRWTGRMFSWYYTPSLQIVKIELKVGTELVWVE